MPAQLVALNDGPSILLDKPILLLGRHPECDIQIDSRKVSRRHCCIAQVSDYLVVRDLGSTNGIRINGVRVQEGRLAPGDELTIGNHRFRVTWDSVAPLPPPRPPAPFKDTLRSALPADEVADDLLESCDEPVPLAEPVGRLRPAGLQGQRRTDMAPPSPPPPSRVPDPGASIIVPDDLRLLPSSSDVFPNVPSHHSGTHHPPA